MRSSTHPARAGCRRSRDRLFGSRRQLGDYARLAPQIAPVNRFVVDFKLESEKGPPKEHRVSAEQVMTELKSAGLAPKVVDVGLPDQYVVSASK